MSCPGKVQCFICKADLDIKQFGKHNLDKHNNLSWKEGDQPLDMKNEKIILSILNKVLKSKKKKILSCDTCHEEKKSALGFFTHKQVCGKSAEEVKLMKVTCDICGRSMMPVSFRPHMQAHERNASFEKANDQEAPIESSIEGEPRSKRAAASKAKSRMSGALLERDLSPPKPSKKSRKYMSYTKLDAALGDPSPKLLEAWKHVIDTQGLVFCLYKDCSFEAYNLNEMKAHVSGCSGFSNHDMAFLCNWCLYQCKDESQVVMHIHSEHLDEDSDVSCAGSESSSDEYLSSGDEKRPKRNSGRQKQSAPQRTFNKMKFLSNTSYGHNKDLDIYPAALNWTYEFRKANYLGNVFSNLNTSEKDWKLLQGVEADLYKPSTLLSVATEITSKAHQSSSRRYNLFESDIVDGVHSMFVGGPVWAMEWCPIPMEECISRKTSGVEYLAVSCHRNMDDVHFAQTCYCSKNIIQLWDCGPLNNGEGEAPKLSLALAHDFGTVWSLAWCPSGAFDSDTNKKSSEHLPFRRLGLLSAACSDGAVRVFSIPFPEQLQCHTREGIPPVYKCDPAMTLVTNFQESSQCTRVSWYQGRNHRLLAGGFTNGMIALWDIENLVPLLWDANLRSLKPYHCFQAHFSVVTAVSFCPDYDGRYLMTGSHDRTVKFWDLEDSSYPLSLHRRSLVTDGVWLGLWISSVTSYDDAFLLEHTNSTLHPVRDFGYKPYPLLVQNSVAWSLSFNEWINAVAQGSEAGDVVISFSNQLFQGIDNEKNSISKRVLLSHTQLKKLIIGKDGKEEQGEVVTWKVANTDAKTNSSKKNSRSRKQTQDVEMSGSTLPSNNLNLELKPRTYEDTIKMYGISHHDFIKGYADKNNIPAEALHTVRLSARMRGTPSDLYPITSINKISWNPNISNFFWLASGHHCGIIRIMNVHFMESPPVRRFLSRVTEELSVS